MLRGAFGNSASFFEEAAQIALDNKYSGYKFVFLVFFTLKTDETKTKA